MKSWRNLKRGSRGRIHVSLMSSFALPYDQATKVGDLVEPLNMKAMERSDL